MDQVIREIEEIRKLPIIMKIPSIFADKSNYKQYLDMEKSCNLRKKARKIAVEKVEEKTRIKAGTLSTHNARINN